MTANQKNSIMMKFLIRVFIFVFFAVPVKIGAQGMEEIIPIKLTEDERKAFDKSAEDVRGMIKKLQ